ncbi:hypothetical protein [Metallibacterium scheffleri]|nr:hypothetical protein [Metallibacterium scheffleri]
MNVERDEAEWRRIVGPSLRPLKLDSPECNGMRMEQLERWSDAAQAGLARVRRLRSDVADRVLAALYLMGHGPRWIQAYFETITWLVDDEGAAKAVDRLVELTWAEGLAEVMGRMKFSRKMERLQIQPQRKRHVEIWRSYGVALLALGGLLGRMQAVGMDAEDVAAQREAWGEWVMRRPVEAGVEGMRYALATAFDRDAVVGCVPADVKRIQIMRWREQNELKSV